jgi:23S rRNA (cytidine1920-2'-O)/16S rRNA (cytidine1409-2'-O)-methyltransferase
MSSGEYVSRAGEKLAGAAVRLNLNFKNKIVLDVGSSTGGFTQYALGRGAAKVIAVDLGTNQLHPSLRLDPRLELHEKTDIRTFKTGDQPDIILIDVSFISLRQVLPAIVNLSGTNTQIAAMVKPQFEASTKDLNKGVIKNDSIRRQVFKDFEQWAKKYFIIQAKADSEVPGARGNRERFYLLKSV